MKLLKSLISIALCFFGVNHFTYSDELESRQAASFPNTFFSSDTEGFSTKKVSVGYYPLYEHADKNSGLAYQTSEFQQDAWRVTTNEITLFTKAINPRNSLGYKFSAGYSEGAKHPLFIIDSQYGFSVGDSTKVELILNRERVETQNAINSGIHYTLAGVSIDQPLLPRVDLVVMGGNMLFSDSNSRPFMKAKLIYDLLPAYGITAQLRYRMFHSTDTEVENNYFNPNWYSETMLAMGVRRRLNGWVLNGVTGLGKQSIDGDESSTTKLLEFSAQSPMINRVVFNTRVAYIKSAGLSGPDYSYHYFMEELVFSF